MDIRIKQKCLPNLVQSWDIFRVKINKVKKQGQNMVENMNE